VDHHSNTRRKSHDWRGSGVYGVYNPGENYSLGPGCYSMKKLLCRLFGHRWGVHLCGNVREECSRCGVCRPLVMTEYIDW
jgi:hypothetical protein